MTRKTYSTILWLTFLTFVGGMLLARLPVSVRAQAGLPPRDTPTPRPDDDKDKEGPPIGAQIELVALNVPAGAWIVVQWQDSAGNWHDVEGWRGWAANSSRWWVHPKDFGRGPFRWVVFGPGGAIGAISPPFHLPGGANETLQVTASAAK
jgi:hypothetical protein